MKSIRRITAAVLALGMTATLGSSFSPNKTAAPGNTVSVKAADDCHDDWIHAEGNRLYDMNGNEVWLTGCNWFGYNVGSLHIDPFAFGLCADKINFASLKLSDHHFIA